MEYGCPLIHTFFVERDHMYLDGSFLFPILFFIIVDTQSSYYTLYFLMSLAWVTVNQREFKWNGNYYALTYGIFFAG